MNPRYPFKKDLVKYQGKTTAVKSIQYVGELAVLKVIYSDLDDKVSKDPHDSFLIWPMWRKVVQKASASKQLDFSVLQVHQLWREHLPGSEISKKISLSSCTLCTAPGCPACLMEPWWEGKGDPSTCCMALSDSSCMTRGRTWGTGLVSPHLSWKPMYKIEGEDSSLGGATQEGSQFNCCQDIKKTIIDPLDAEEESLRSPPLTLVKASLARQCDTLDKNRGSLPLTKRRKGLLNFVGLMARHTRSIEVKGFVRHWCTVHPNATRTWNRSGIPKCLDWRLIWA